MGGDGRGIRLQNPSPGSFFRIEIRRLQKEGGLVPELEESWDWRIEGRVVASMRVKHVESGLLLSYERRFRDHGDQNVACGRCRKLTYPIQRIAPMLRGSARAQQIRVRPGGSVDLTLPFPPRPKGMHDRTYTRLWLQARQSDHRTLDHLESWMKEQKARRVALEQRGRTNGTGV